MANNVRIFFIFYFVFIVFFQVKSNTIEGDVKVLSCNCSECCYTVNSKLSLLIAYNFDKTYSLQMNGNPNGTNCNIYIQRLELCQQTSEMQIGTIKYRYLNCTFDNSTLGELILYGDFNDETKLYFNWKQKNQECLLVVNSSYKLKNEIITTLILMLFVLFLLSF